LVEEAETLLYIPGSGDSERYRRLRQQSTRNWKEPYLLRNVGKKSLDLRSEEINLAFVAFADSRLIIVETSRYAH
jgi:hypothetical protein